MAKDPAALFYSNDFLTGTAHMTREEKGLYIELLCHQQQRGALSVEFLKRIAGVDFERLWPGIKDKFIEDSAGKFFNKRMQEEVERRKKFTDSRRKNLESKPHMDDHKETDMDNHTGDRMEIEIEIEKRNSNGNNEGGTGETKNCIYVDGEMILLEKLQEWFDENFFMQKDNWMKLYPYANLKVCLNDFGLARSRETFKDIQHFKNAFALKLKDVNEKNGRVAKKSVTTTIKTDNQGKRMGKL
jgi:uncharacterized protein YdaU (DUF1376 family)